ncbi:MAG: RelA/SpoT family protein [Elusimicrobiales bacterium]|nr:RelA/SpoT family protein [Elusimicrobiales bacterium]
MTYEALAEKYLAYVPDADMALLEKAYKFSENAHSAQTRASGEKYFSHCYAVADILLDYKLDQPTVCAALLHDVLEDTPVSTEQFNREFGEEITQLVLGVTKIEHFKFTSVDEETAENWRKMLLATAADVRVILIKLADRLHNMRTLQFLTRERQQSIAEETLTLYAPLAQRLGIFSLKAELEDLSFKAQHPAEYADLSAKLEATSAKRREVLESFRAELESRLAQSGIPHRVLARTKNLYSIYRKMQSQNRPFEEIQDSLGVRIITDTVANCYALVGLVHSHFKPLAGSFTDYIALPKMNLYQSLHTTVVSAAGDIVEVQLRTEEMHRTSEYGIAAHWRYKLGKAGKDAHFDEKINWLRQWIEWLQDLTSPREFLETLRTDMELQQVFVFTPKGEVKAIPKGSTTLDFAFAIHSEIGEHCFGARVNNKMVSLDYELKSGDICEILTRKNSSPRPDWVKIVRTGRSRSRIRRYLREHGLSED